MEQYRYNAIKQTGEPVKGSMEALNRSQVVDHLFEMGLTPVAVTSSKKKLAELLSEEREFIGGYNEKSRAVFCRSLTRFLESGLTIERALSLSAEMTSTKVERKVVDGLVSSVRKGMTLSAGMLAQGERFPRDMVAQISAAERTGTLESVMSSLATSLERSVAFKTRVRSALIYPSILMLVVVMTLILVVGVVLPRFAPLFENAGQELPILTQVVMGFGIILTQFWWLWLLMLMGLIVGFFIVRKKPEVRLKWHEAILNNKWMRQFIAMPDFIRLARGWGAGIESGLPADESLSLASSSIVNLSLAKRLSTMLKSIQHGGRIGSLVLADEYLPIIMQQLALAGDETGRLGAMLVEAANLMETDYETRLERVTGMLAPILTLVSGGIVALLVLAVMMGMMSINDLAF